MFIQSIIFFGRNIVTHKATSQCCTKITQKTFDILGLNPSLGLGRRQTVLDSDLWSSEVCYIYVCLSVCLSSSLSSYLIYLYFTRVLNWLLLWVIMVAMVTWKCSFLSTCWILYDMPLYSCYHVLKYLSYSYTYLLF